MEEEHTLNTPRSIPYSGFTLTTCRREDSGGWHPIVKDRQGRLVCDDIGAPWISQSQAEKRAVDIAKREIAKMGEAAPDDPECGDIWGAFDDV